MNHEKNELIDPADALLDVIAIEGEQARISAREMELIRQYRSGEISGPEYHSGIEVTSHNLTELKNLHDKVVGRVNVGEIHVQPQKVSRLGAFASKLGLRSK